MKSIIKSAAIISTAILAIATFIFGVVFPVGFYYFGVVLAILSIVSIGTSGYTIMDFVEEKRALEEKLYNSNEELETVKKEFEEDMKVFYEKLVEQNKLIKESNKALKEMLASYEQESENADETDFITEAVENAGSMDELVALMNSWVPKNLEIGPNEKLFGNGEFLEKKFSILGGVGYLFKYPNGYSADIVCHGGSYGHEEGLWEVAILYDDEYVSDTPISEDSVIPGQTDEEVEEILCRIRELPAA